MRGHKSKEGDTRTSQNGYHYTRTPQGWRLTHHLLMEEELGRPLNENERVLFKDGDRTNLSIDNLRIQTKRELSVSSDDPSSLT